MNLRKKMMTFIGLTALLASMTSGMVAAQPTDQDSAPTVLNASCPITPNVTVTVDGQFEVDVAAGEDSAELTDGNFTVVMDLRCNWSNQFDVHATIGTFTFQGIAPAGTASTLSPAHLTLVDGDGGNYVGVCNHTGLLFDPCSTPYDPLVPFAAPPQVKDEVFALLPIDFSIIENESSVFGLVNYAAPGVTTAKWNGEMTDLPPNLADGIYQAPLTVYLYVQ